MTGMSWVLFERCCEGCTQPAISAQDRFVGQDHNHATSERVPNIHVSAGHGSGKSGSMINPLRGRENSVFSFQFSVFSFQFSVFSFQNLEISSLPIRAIRFIRG